MSRSSGTRPHYRHFPTIQYLFRDVYLLYPRMVLMAMCIVVYRYLYSFISCTPAPLLDRVYSGQNNKCINNGNNTISLARPPCRAPAQPHPQADAGLAANLGATFPSASLGLRSVVEPPPDPVRCLPQGSPLRTLPQGRGRLAV